MFKDGEPGNNYDRANSYYPATLNRLGDLINQMVGDPNLDPTDPRFDKTVALRDCLISTEFLRHAREAKDVLGKRAFSKPELSRIESLEKPTSGEVLDSYEIASDMEKCIQSHAHVGKHEARHLAGVVMTEILRGMQTQLANSISH